MISLPGYAALRPAASLRSAVSDEADTVSRAASAVVSHVEGSLALFGPKAAAISAIWELLDECATSGWDGEQAQPISGVAAASASEFIRALPEDIPLPEFAPEPDGSISMDWIRSRSRLFSISVGPGGWLAYAWLDGSDRGHAIARFDGETPPPRILEGIRSIVDSDHAAFRST